MQKILITGGAGFIGSHLAQHLLKKGNQVRILDTLSPQIHGMLPSTDLRWLTQPGLEFVRGSVSVEADLKVALEDVDAIVHLASETGTGQSMYEIDRYCHQNVQGTALLVNMIANGAAPAVKRIVLASSRSVYGEGAYTLHGSQDSVRITPPSRSAEALRKRQWEPVCPDSKVRLTAVPTREVDRTAPASIYAATKLMQEDLIRIGCESAKVGFAILRLQNVYGEGQSLKNPYTGILSIFSTRIRRDLKLPIFEDGQETRDFVHVSDVVAAFAAALETSDAINTIVNVGSGIATSVLDAAKSLCRAFDAKENIEITGEFRVGDIRHNLADCTRLQKHLNLQPQVSLDEGLKRFADWVKTQPLPEDQLHKANQELQKRDLMG